MFCFSNSRNILKGDSTCLEFVMFVARDQLLETMLAMRIIKQRKCGIPIFRNFDVLIKQAQLRGLRYARAVCAQALLRRPYRNLENPELLIALSVGCKKAS